MGRRRDAKRQEKQKALSDKNLKAAGVPLSGGHQVFSATAKVQKQQQQQQPSRIQIQLQPQEPNTVITLETDDESYGEDERRVNVSEVD